MELYQADLRRRGLPEAEARRRALADFGSLDARRDECREAVGLQLLDELRGDVAYAFRLLRASPAFTIVALLSLALGIGATTAIFSRYRRLRPARVQGVDRRRAGARARTVCLGVLLRPARRPRDSSGRSRDVNDRPAATRRSRCG